MLFCVYLISYNNTAFFIIFPTIFYIIHYLLLSFKVITNIIWDGGCWSGFRFSPALFRDFLRVFLVLSDFLKEKILKLFLLWVLYTTRHSIVYTFQ